MLAHSVHYRLLFSNLKVEINNLMSERGELVGETEPVFSLNVCCPCVAIVLFLNVFIQGTAIRGCEFHVDIIVATCDHLLKQTQKINIILILSGATSKSMVPFSDNTGMLNTYRNLQWLVTSCSKSIVQNWRGNVLVFLSKHITSIYSNS